MVAHLFSTAQTGYFYTTKRLRLGPPLTQIKYDPQGMPTSYNRLPSWLTNTLRSSKAEGLVCREEKEEVARRTRLCLSPIQGHCCIPYLLPTCIYPTSTDIPMLVLQLSYSVLLQRESAQRSYVPVDTYEQEDECYKVRDPIGRSYPFGACRRARCEA